jgi:hyaluronan synthase
MIATVVEMVRYFFSGIPSLFLIVVIYFWAVWGIKFVFSRFYRPDSNDFSVPVSVIIPTYNEDGGILIKSINSVRSYSSDDVREILVVTDVREQDVVDRLRYLYKDESRVNILVSEPGKRAALSLGILSAKEDIVVVVESDTFVNEDTIPELIRPFKNVDVGGVVADQRIYEPYKNITNFFNMVSEKVKYTITIPALSIFNQVTVLGGRCVAYRRRAVLPLISRMLNEKFLRTRCIAGDDGRFTSLILEDGWKTKYQSTSYVETVSPSTFKNLINQRLRWLRNSARRTSRAITWDGLWVWKKGAAVLQMLSTWTNTIMMFLLLYTVVVSISSMNWFWFGSDWMGLGLRVGVLVVGLMLTRVLRTNFILRDRSRKKWLWITLFPWFLFLMFWLKIFSIITMNRQGWVSRVYKGPGGFTNK